MNNANQSDQAIEIGDTTSTDRIGAEHSVRFTSLDSGHSRIERLAIAFVRGLRTAVPISLLATSDLVALFASGLLATWLSQPLEPRGTIYLFFVTYCGITLLVYAFSGLYSDTGRNGPDELRRLSLSTTLSVIILALAVYVSGNFYTVRIVVFPIAWAGALLLVPLARTGILSAFAHRGWWGHKAIIVSQDPRTACRLVEILRSQPQLGIRPQAILSTNGDSSSAHALGIPQLNGPGPALEQARSHGIDYAIMTLSDFGDETGLDLLRRYEHIFKHWLIVPHFPQNYSLWVRARDLNGLLGLEVTNRLNRQGDQLVKRLMDLALTLVGGLCILPLCMIVALAIKLDSKGPALYSQERLGKNGKPFKALKFRSMIADADSVLHDLLEVHPELKQEWEDTQKIKDDPRITRLGQFLRRTSIDELPQLINVLRGDMSLVGPRPCMPDQVPLYGWVWELYKRARPGITGQWQVSGRNGTSYATRAVMDAYYIRNWSIWLDVHILVKTVAVVLLRRGAY